MFQQWLRRFQDRYSDLGPWESQRLVLRGIQKVRLWMWSSSVVPQIQAFAPRPRWLMTRVQWSVDEWLWSVTNVKEENDRSGVCLQDEHPRVRRGGSWHQDLSWWLQTSCLSQSKNLPRRQYTSSTKIWGKNPIQAHVKKIRTDQTTWKRGMTADTI